MLIKPNGYVFGEHGLKIVTLPIIRSPPVRKSPLENRSSATEKTSGSKWCSENICRVSSGKQTTASQLSELRDYCARRGWKSVEEITDVVSGAKSSREGLDRLMAAVRRGKVDVVVCFKLDRLGRSLAHLAQLIGEFAAHNVALVVPSQVSTPQRQTLPRACS